MTIVIITIDDHVAKCYRPWQSLNGEIYHDYQSVDSHEISQSWNRIVYYHMDPL